MKSRQMVISNDTENSTPISQYPPIWEIKSDCGPQTLDLRVTDADDDRVVCNFGYPAISGSSSEKIKEKLKSIQLNEKTCELTYHPSLDTSTRGYKAISLVLEDYKSLNSSARSSTNISFLAKVSNQTACNNVPVFNLAISEKGFLYLNKTLDNVKVVATSSTYITEIQTTKGLCTKSKRKSTNLVANCRLQATKTCLQAADLSGASSELCFTPKLINGSILFDIAKLAFKFLGLKALDLNNYGCYGRGFFDLSKSSGGRPVDQIDGLFHEWRNCRKCAGTNSETEYYFDFEAQLCGKITLVKLRILFQMVETDKKFYHANAI